MYRDEQLFDIIERIREHKHKHSGSKAAAIVTPCSMMVGNNPDRNKSKAASVPNIIKVKEISDFISSNGTL